MALALAGAFTIVGNRAQALPFVDLFAKDLEQVPATEELRRQEDEARAKLNEALALEARRPGKALDEHQSIVRRYPLTTAAAMSQYKIGELLRADGKDSRAFDAFQTFVENYKGSSAFPDAIRNQYEIAQQGGDGGRRSRVLGVIPRKVQKSELLEWYGKIVASAPFSEYAPLSQFAIAEIYEEQEQSAMAIAAYQAIVDKYPRHAKAAEAQFRIGNIGRTAVESGSQDLSNIQSARGAFEDVLLAYEDSERATEARAALQQFDAVEAEKMFEVGQFYEKQKKFRSAAVYYRKVAAMPGSPRAAEAQQRLDQLVAAVPDEVEERRPLIPRPRLGLGRDGASEVAAAGDGATPPDAAARPGLLKARSNYVGPPAPDLAIVAPDKPKMRTNPAAVPIVPLEEQDPDPLPPPPPPIEEEALSDTLPPPPAPEPAPEEEPLPPIPALDDDGFLTLPPPPPAD